MPSARMAYARNLPKRFRVKSDTRSAVPGGSALRAGRTATTAIAPARSPQRSRLRIAPLGREEPRWTALDEQDHEHQDQDLPEDRAHPWLDDLVEPADSDRGEDAPGQLPDPARHHHHEGVHDVVLAELRAHVADLGDRATREAGQARPEREGARVHPPRADAQAGG